MNHLKKNTYVELKNENGVFLVKQIKSDVVRVKKVGSIRIKLVKFSDIKEPNTLNQEVCRLLYDKK